MTATSTTRLTDHTGPMPTHGTYPVAANELILKGTIVAIDENGRAIAGVAGEGHNAVGIARFTADNRTTAPEGGGAGAIDVEVDFGEFTNIAYTGTAPDAGQPVFIADNQTVTLDSGSATNGLAGVCTRDGASGLCAVLMGPHVAGLVSVDSAVTARVLAVEAAVDALEADALTAQACIPIPLNAWLADGVPLQAFADGSQNGVQLTDSEVAAFRWNPVGEDTSTLSTTIPMPQDLDDTADVVIHALVARIGEVDTTAALVGNAFFQTVGAAYDADADAISSNSAAVDGATKVAHELTLTIAAADVPAAPCALTVTLTPSSALDADDMLLLAAWVEYTRKVLEA